MLDTSKIEGYAEMSAEDKVAALEAYEISYEGYVKKDVFDKASSDAAKWKKKFKDTQDAETQAKEAEAEKLSTLQLKYDELFNKYTLGENEKEFLSLGYEASLAKEAAEAMSANDTAKLFKIQKKHIDAVQKAARKEALQSTPAPAPGDSSVSITKADLRKMTMQERAQFSIEHPEEYRALYGD